MIHQQTLRHTRSRNIIYRTAFLSLPPDARRLLFNGVESQLIRALFAGGGVDNETSIDLLLTFALDLLAQNERQQRAIVRAQAQLSEYIAEACEGTPTLERRRACIDRVDAGVNELVAVTAVQSALLADMQSAVSALRARR